MWKKIGIGLGVIVVVLAAYIAIRLPKEFIVTRSTTLASAPSVVFVYVNSPRLMQQWNPFTEGDPTVKLEYAGPETGVGAQSKWVGDKAGDGTATITESVQDQKVTVRLDFVKPFAGTNEGEYLLTPEGGGTKLTWTLTEKAAMPRLMSIFCDLDGYLGGVFEKGFASLKPLVEKPQ